MFHNQNKHKHLIIHQQHQHHLIKVIISIHSHHNVQHAQLQIVQYVVDHQYVQHVILDIIGKYHNIYNKQQIIHKVHVNHVCKDVKAVLIINHAKHVSQDFMLYSHTQELIIVKVVHQLYHNV